MYHVDAHSAYNTNSLYKQTQTPNKKMQICKIIQRLMGSFTSDENRAAPSRLLRNV
jgi:hypothetical protein